MQVHVHYSSSFPSHSPFFEGSPYKRPPIKEVTVPQGYLPGFWSAPSFPLPTQNSLPATQPSEGFTAPTIPATAPLQGAAQSTAPTFPATQTSQGSPAQTPATSHPIPAITQTPQPMQENGLEQQIKALRDHANHLEQMLENRVLKGQIEALKQENEALQRRCKDLESERQLHEGELETLKLKNAQLESAVCVTEKLRGELSSLQAIHNRLQNVTHAHVLAENAELKVSHCSCKFNLLFANL